MEEYASIRELIASVNTSAFLGTDSHNLLDRRRDSALSFGNCLKLRGTDGYQNRALEPRVTIIGP